MTRFSILALFLSAACSLAQQSGNSKASSSPPPQAQPSPDQSKQAQSPSKQPPASPKSDDMSSSRDTRIDTTAPKDDAKNHPNSKDAVSDLVPPPADNSGVQEFHPWNPYKANKDIQVGDFYFRRKNYKAALDRYKEALYYKQNDAVATFRLAQCYEKTGDKNEARTYFEQYLKILPEGPLAKEAHAALDKLAQKRESKE